MKRLPKSRIEEYLSSLCSGYVEEPVSMRAFIENPKYLNAPEMWPAVKEDLIELFDSPVKYDRAIFDEGIGAGKSYKSSIITAYLLYRLMCLRNPQEHWELAPGSTIVLLNMASNAKQAHKVVFSEVKNRVEQCRWFRQHGFMPDPDVHSELRFPKNVVVMPGNSSATFPLGYNLIGGVLDEAAWYTDNKQRDLAEEIYEALDNRIRSRFGQDGMLVVISSPRYVDDFIETLMADAKNRPTTLAKRRETWNAKPNWKGEFFELGHPQTGEIVKIPIELQDAFQKNPEKAWRDFGAVPSLVLEPYIKQFNLVKSCVDMTRTSPFIDEQNGILQHDFRPNPHYTYFLHIDLALKRDAAGIAMAHGEADGKIVVDFMRRIVGSSDKEIDISEIKNFVIGLYQKGFRLGKVTYDQFQSAGSIQDLKKQGINAETLSVDATLAPYETFKEMCYTKRLSFYHHPVFLSEVERLELVEGKRVDHPPKGSKDVADAVAGAVVNVVQTPVLLPLVVKIL